MSRKRDPNLPKNLTYRKDRKTFAWRNPLTNKEITLGQLSRREAIAQAIEANYYLEQNHTPYTLIERLKETNSYTMADWIERYEVILKRRELADNTYKARTNQLITIKERMGGLILQKISTQHIAEFLEIWTSEGKNTMAGSMRSVLSDMFNAAMEEGRVLQNPVVPTRAPKISIARERLRLEFYQATRTAADRLPAWFPLAMDLAMVTAQRREDITHMQFSHIHDDRLYVTQIKTGMKIAIPLSLALPAVGLCLRTVIDRCRLVSRTDFIISAGIWKYSPTGNVHPDTLTKKFVAARKLSGMTLSDNPPTFHEIRSLAGRLYKDAYGEDFAQKLLGHTSESTTKLYLDERDDRAYVLL
ncbi:TPA: phage integrase Arm DNA-binding domain-containing protein [Salmonella enterica]|nr:phage integrase Arm DNA-binding domain-containing protein [Salmonella enterica]